MDMPVIDSEVLVSAYSTELTRAVKMKNEENIVRMFQLNFEKFFDIAVSGSRFYLKYMVRPNYAAINITT